MTVRYVAMSLVVVLVLAACGGDDGETARGNGDGDTQQEDVGSSGGDGSVGGDVGGSETPEPVGPADMNTIRIGSETWSRTLPMTSGQCFLPAEDGGDPTGGTVWGTLDGNDDLRFNVGYEADGSHGAEVNDNERLYWIAGVRSPNGNDLQFEIDFDAQTITGSGTFTSLTTGEVAAGSFAFQCEGE